MTNGIPGIAPLPPTSGRRMEQVTTAVRSAIDGGLMLPGIKYSVYQLAASLEVSRTPIRDALLRLEEAGLVKFEARQGFRILLPEPKEIADIFSIRLALEVPAAKRAALTSTPELTTALEDRMRVMYNLANSGDEAAFAAEDQALHDHIMSAAGNSRAQTIVGSLRESTKLLGASTADRSRTMFEINADHRPIVAAITAGSPDTAARFMQAHLTSTGRLLIEQAIKDQGADLDVDRVWSDSIDMDVT